MGESVNQYLNKDRKDFEKSSLSEDSVLKNPLHLFESWLKEAIAAESAEAYAMTLSTIADGAPRSRVVYLRGYENGKFLFYTNYLSQKGNEIEENDNVCLNFYWPKLERQVRINGKAEKCTAKVSETYFNSRPRLSQIGAWASEQSAVLQDRKELESKVKFFTDKFEGKEVPRPDNWGGYSVSAFEIEFWQGRKSRLHDRLFYKLYGSSWTIQRKSP